MAFSDVLGGAGTGAVMGSAFGVPGAVVGGLLGGLGGLFGGNAADRANQAQQDIAMAQLGEARRAREFALGRAAASESELQLQQALTGMRRQVLGQGERELQFLQSGLDMRQPGAYEQGAGLFSSVLLRQRQAQRSLLESQLRQRFGSGFATSSAGQQALQQFDMGTSDLATQMIPQVLQSQYAAIGQESQLQNIIKNREIQASLGTPIAQYAGAQNIAGLLGAQREQQMFGNLLRLGGTVAGAKFGQEYLGGAKGAISGAQIGSGLFGQMTSPQGQSGYSFLGAS